MRTLKILSVLAFILLTSAFAVNSFGSIDKQSNASPEGCHIGDAATDFSLKNVNGEMVSLKDFTQAKGFIVVFTTNHCPYAQAYEKRIIALNAKYQSKGYPVIAINPNDPDRYPEDSFKNMQRRARGRGYKFPYLFDSEQEVYPVYGATKTPHVYVLQKENNQNIVRYIGTIDDNYQDASAVKQKFVEDAVDALLAGKEVPIKTTKAIGCSIE